MGDYHHVFISSLVKDRQKIFGDSSDAKTPQGAVLTVCNRDLGAFGLCSKYVNEVKLAPNPKQILHPKYQ